jgi:hypothetical protein
MTRLTTPEQAVRFADFIRTLYRKGVLTLSQARNGIDRFAFNLDKKGLEKESELASAVYMRLERDRA